MGREPHERIGDASMHVTSLSAYALSGYHVERDLFSGAEIAAMKAHYMSMRESGPHPGDFAGAPSAATFPPAADPLAKYPRLINMHAWDVRTSDWMVDPRLVDTVSGLFGQPAVPLQTMVYFKPPGARGQSFHQDNLYLRVTPIAAAWVALDPCDSENGAMEMIRGSHLLGLLPCRLADTNLSFTDSETVTPAYLSRDLIELDAGDAVFFHGLTIHGSAPNRTPDRFRRAFICHYQGAETWPIVAPPLPNRVSA